MRKVILGTLIIVILVGGILLVDREMRLNRPVPKESSGEEGKVLPTSIEFRNFATKEKVTFNDFKGKVVMVNFWASWCEACMSEMPSIQKLYDTLKGEGLEVIAVNVDENPDRVVPQIVKKLNLSFPIFTDADGGLSQAFEVSAIPLTIVADRDQNIIWTESGERDWASEEVIGEVRKLLK